MTDQERAEALYRQGNQYRQQGDWQHAMECYNHATEFDPSSPAAKAREMLDSILAYRCKAMFNP